MENYYELLGLSIDAPIDVLRRELNQKMRLWSHRTNAPQIERRQEAERMVRLLEEVEETLLDEGRRNEYNKALQEFLDKQQNETEASQEASAKSDFQQVDWEQVKFISSLDDDHDDVAAAVEEQVEPSSPKISDEDRVLLIAKGEDYLQQNRLSEALEIAERLIKEAELVATVWAFMGEVRIAMQDYHEATTAFVKSLDLDPQNAAYVAQLGKIFTQQGKWERARHHFKRATTLDPDNIDYRFYLGSTLVKQGEEIEGLKLLETCVRINPDNREYLRELAQAYLEMACSGWTQVPAGNPYLPPGRYPTRNADLKRAKVFLDRARRLPIQDIELRNDIHRLHMEIQSHGKRKFTGSWWMFALSIMFLVGIDIYNFSYLNTAFIALPLIYLISAMAPSFRIYSKAAVGKTGKTDFAYFFAKMKDRFGTKGAVLFSVLLCIPYAPCTPFVLSLVILRNFYKNYSL
ncbi:Tetratricopeptide repeat-containing protein [Seinonella peptonophila]|uniref:Tetratricopeptide repeat-containing protein n=1 Tax=Seinonella peptonophila TaxID=112248 RepID=A0A1M4YUA6_9BACL|nr:tetratricopeptide repeat protein [Seinonella peptonophila]SHF08936.1 Tetratricopeptide repeat-containing protein [Seinonella peptonophila]